MGHTAAAGAGTAGALPHFTTCSSSPSYCSHSPTHASALHRTSEGPYPRIHPSLEHGHVHGGVHGHGLRRPHSWGSSVGTVDSWQLSAVNPSGQPLSRSSITAPAGGPVAAANAAKGGDSSSGKHQLQHPWQVWGSQQGATATAAAQQGVSGGYVGPDGHPLGPVRHDDMMIDFGKLAAQAAAPSGDGPYSAAALAAGAGVQQVIQVHYTGAVDAVPLQHTNPSHQQVRALSQLLPPAPDSGGSAAMGSAVADAGVEGARLDQGVDGVVLTVEEAGTGEGVKGSSSSGRGGRYRQRLQQWKAAVGSRVRGLKGGRGGRGAAAAAEGLKGAGSMRSSGSTNEHMFGFGGEFLCAGVMSVRGSQWSV